MELSVQRASDSYTISLLLAYRFHQQPSRKIWAKMIRQQAKIMEAKSDHRKFKQLCKGIRKNKFDEKVLMCMELMEVRYFEATKLNLHA